MKGRLVIVNECPRKGGGGSGFLRGRETRKEVSETLQTCLWSHTPRSCSLLGQAEFLAAGQHVSVAQDELECPQPFLMVRGRRKFLP